ncbi:MAG: response regulator [Deltaproteobacteria bacterium]|nr:response regulator [Deltaproteobacteria bacterium]
MAFVLIIDDNPQNLQFMTYLLTALGYRTKSAASIADGLELVSDADPPQLIISDLNLPARSGFDLLKTVRARPALDNTPCVILSATSRSESDVEAALRLGAAKFIHRPLEPQELLAELGPYLPDRMN